jgi:hypothetical protein
MYDTALPNQIQLSCDVICVGLTFFHRRENKSVVLRKDVERRFLVRVQRRILEAYGR